jgi:hypothetical protein
VAGDLLDGLDAVQLHTRPDQVPVEAERQLVAVNVQLIGRHHLETRCEREVVDEVKRLDLWLEAEHEVG